MGFLHPRDEKLTPIIVEHSVNSDTVISATDEFCHHIDKKTVVIIDNASIHTARAVNDKLDEWMGAGLELLFLPVYSPELNLIEILWRKMKYEWISFSSYEGTNKLRDNLNEILSGFGAGKYHIKFS